MNNELHQSAATPAVSETFDDVVLPHLDAAHRLARWLMRNEHDAEDVVQDASLRALRYFRTFAGGDGRAWFLRIVRNTCASWYRTGGHAPTAPFDEEQHSDPALAADPETLLLRADAAALIDRALLLNPNLAFAWLFSGITKNLLGEPNIAITHFARAARLNPLGPYLIHSQMGTGWLIFSPAVT